MSYTLIYRLRFKNDERNADLTENGQIITVDISPVSSEGEGDITVIELTPAANPFVTKSIDNDRDKFTPIRSTQAIIKFIADDNYDITTFSEGGDNEWIVTAYSPASVIFKGFLVTADLNQPFLPNPQEVTLTASDHLGILKEIPLTDFDGNNPRGWNKISKYLAWALSKTGLNLDLLVAMNIREETMPAVHFYDGVYIEARTFELNIGESVDCYSVISSILDEDAVIFQKNGVWWIQRIDEVEIHPTYLARFINGDFQNFLSEREYNKTVGRSESIKFAQADCILELERPLGFLRETYNYEYPLEVVCNIDFQRGDLIEVISSEEKRYDIDCWTFAKYSTNPNPESFPAPDTVAYIQRNFVNDTEKERFVVLPLSAPTHALMSEHVWVHKNDKVNISVDFRWKDDKSGAGYLTIFIFNVFLLADDGSRYTLDDDGKWYLTDPTWTTNYKTIQQQWIPNDVDEREWRTVSVNSTGIPKDGRLFIGLRANQSGGTGVDDTDVHYANLTIEYLPYITGTYQKYRGQVHEIKRNSKYLAKRDKVVKISDSPKRLFKGALGKPSGGVVVLTERFYNAAVFPSGVPSPEYLHPFGKIQAFSVWNQYRNTVRIFSGTLRGITSSQLDPEGLLNYPSLLHKYFLQDSNLNTNNKRFILLDFEIDWKTCIWRGVFAEVYDITKPKYYDDDYTFQYIT